jgi:gluconokinase
MASDIPLTDADRWSWLILLRNVASEKLHDGANGVVVTCSALKQRYRDVIRTAGYYDHNVLVHFIYLQATPELLLARVKARENHYMKDSMVKSQLDCLEPPDENEFDALTIDVSGSVHDVQNLAYQAVYRVIVNDSTESNGA